MSDSLFVDNLQLAAIKSHSLIISSYLWYGTNRHTQTHTHRHGYRHTHTNTQTNKDTDITTYRHNGQRGRFSENNQIKYSMEMLSLLFC